MRVILTTIDIVIFKLNTKSMAAKRRLANGKAAEQVCDWPVTYATERLALILQGPRPSSHRHCPERTYRRRTVPATRPPSHSLFYPHLFDCEVLSPRRVQSDNLREGVSFYIVCLQPKNIKTSIIVGLPS